MVLLRRTVAALRRAGTTVGLLAPSGPGSALVGPGPSEVSTLVPWERADVAALVGGEPPGPALREALEPFDAALVYSRDPDLARALGAVVAQVAAHDPRPEGSHAARWLAAPLAAWGIDGQEAPPPLRATAAEAAAADHATGVLGRGFLALHPGSGSARKNWPRERFVEVAERLASGRPFAVVEGPAEPGVAASFGPRAVPLAGLAPRVLGACLARAALLVGNDSGVSHLAAAWGVPTVAVFGPTDPAVWGPDGASVRTLRSGDGRLAGVTVDEVVSCAARALPSG